LNTTNLDSLKRPEIVRTLTIRCPHFSKKKSTPAAGLFRGLHKLYSLIIKNARLPTIPNDLFAHTPNLMTLDMSGNELRIEPYSLKSLRSVFELHNLIHLDLSNNSINFLANTLISLTKLNVLTMDHNNSRTSIFAELSDLSLRHNFITTLHYAPPSVSYRFLRNLRRIDLSGNMLEFISGSGSVNMLPAGLKQADLSNNRISFVQDGALSLMEKLALLDLKYVGSLFESRHFFISIIITQFLTITKR
ncbi:leucine Rich repeat-containing domain protein, partial [Necator americanus]